MLFGLALFLHSVLTPPQPSFFSRGTCGGPVDKFDLGTANNGHLVNTSNNFWGKWLGLTVCTREMLKPQT